MRFPILFWWGNITSDKQRIQKIYENAVKLYEYIMGHQIKKADLLTEMPMQWLVTTPLYNIGEYVYNLPNEYKEAHNEIQWAMIAGLRHRLIQAQPFFCPKALIIYPHKPI